jgi:hypothetical protein
MDIFRDRPDCRAGEVSQTAVSVLKNTPKHVSAKGAHIVPHTEAMRSDEVTLPVPSIGIMPKSQLSQREEVPK